jgi:hypothetical protein
MYIFGQQAELLCTINYFQLCTVKTNMGKTMMGEGYCIKFGSRFYSHLQVADWLLVDRWWW